MNCECAFLSKHILSTLVFLPAIFGLLLFAFKNERLVKLFALCSSLLVFTLSLVLWSGFNPHDAAYQYVENFPWITSFGIRYSIGIDGISLYLVLLTTFLMPLIIIASDSIKESRTAYLAMMLFLETAMLGTLVALDVFLFYVFWELMLAPMYFIIGIWGGKRRIYATLKFVLYTVVGSLLMLVAIFYLVWSHYNQTGDLTFGLQSLFDARLSLQEEVYLFLAFAIAFCIKVPLFPFHTWLPDAHVEAPTGGSVVLAGVLLKMGIYGLLRFAIPLFPRAAEIFAPYIGLLAVIGIIYGALIAWVQTDIKKLIAYSSVSHLGYCVLGLFAGSLMSISGTIFQMLSHGLTTGALFFLVGVLYDRKHTRLMADYGGLAAKIPVFSFFFLVFTLGSIALPLTSGFIGEFLILAGSFGSFPYFTILAVSGVVLGAVYMLMLYRKTVFGELDLNKNADLTDLLPKETFIFVVLLIVMFGIGIYPKTILSDMELSIKNNLEITEQRKQFLKTQDEVK